MKSVKGTRTEQNLLKSFAGESQARSRYTFFAEVAKKEGYEQIAAVFIETAEQEREHAKRFFNFLEGGEVEITACYPAGKVGTTQENLLAAAMGEKEEWDTLYAEFAQTASEEGFPAIAATFKNIAKVEAKGIFPAVARPAATPNILFSAIPQSKNLSGNFFLNTTVFVASARSASRTTISLSIPPNSARALP